MEMASQSWPPDETRSECIPDDYIASQEAVTTDTVLVPSESGVSGSHLERLSNHKTPPEKTPTLYRSSYNDPASLKLLWEEAKNAPRLTASEEISLAQRIETGDIEAWKNMIRAHLGGALYTARKYRRRGVDIDDLTQEAILGLIEAIGRNDWRKGFRLSTLTKKVLKNTLNKAVIDQSRTIRLPKDVHYDDRIIQKARSQLASQGCQNPSPEIIASTAQLDIDTVKSALRAAVVVKVTSLHEPLGNDEESRELGDIIEDRTSISPVEEVEAKLAQEALKKLMEEVLTPMERAVLEGSYGLFGAEEKTQNELATALNKTQTVISSIHRRALEKLFAVRNKLPEAA